MIYPAADKIEEQIDSKYALVILAAKRAKQLKEGSKPLIKTESVNPLTVALEEIASGQVRYQFDENSLAGREALSDQQAVVGRRDLEVDGIDPLATPEPDENYARAAAALGADLDDLLGNDDELEEVMTEGDETEEEEEDPILIADEEDTTEV
ncbi:MAG: DNA-directed RNA polymerase subunit omega [Capsulimonadales bacterium]|nr:DNA-directed RNA polymerase subunit omega [Capsulimonadales bacterium]